jgi:2-oxoglutarate dehydrogenase E2 component (dihydrolipoamide succinyltransferase)
MSLEIKVPPVGESITEVTLSSWLKKDGDTVQMDEVIAELESDKATFELTAEKAGTLKTIAKEGDTLAIGAPVASIEESGTAAPATIAASAPAVKATSEAIAEPADTNNPSAGASTSEIKVPPVGESITEVTLSRWIKKDGDTVAMDEAIAELESDKATFELTADKAGTLNTIAKEGDVLAIGAPVASITGGGGVLGGSPAADPTASAPAAAAPAVSSDKNYATGTPSPAAAKILAEKGIAPTAVSGNGVNGRITKEDAIKANLVSESPQAPVVSPTVKPSPVAATKAVPVSFSGDRADRREKMSSLRKTVAKRLVAVKNETAMLTTFNEVDMSPIMEIRSKYKDKFKEKHGVGLGFMSFFTKAVCEALKEWPSVGARIDGDEIVYSNYADISIAVSAPKGLVVPVIRNAEAMSLDQIEKAVAALAVKARESKLTLEEMTGGTFTITNGGVFGSLMSTPIINSPQSAILGMHNIVERPIALNGQVVIRPMMYIALSYDHRIIDGRESVSFLVRVKQLLEDPTRLLLGV